MYAARCTDWLTLCIRSILFQLFHFRMIVNSQMYTKLHILGMMLFGICDSTKSDLWSNHTWFQFVSDLETAQDHIQNLLKNLSLSLSVCLSVSVYHSLTSCWVVPSAGWIPSGGCRGDTCRCGSVSARLWCGWCGRRRKLCRGCRYELPSLWTTERWGRVTQIYELCVGVRCEDRGCPSHFS